MTYRTFTRTWWKDNPIWPEDLEPDVSDPDYSKSTEYETEQEARKACLKWNGSHVQGRYRLKMEYEEL